jgi:hypothetical protein
MLNHKQVSVSVLLYAVNHDYIIREKLTDVYMYNAVSSVWSSTSRGNALDLSLTYHISNECHFELKIYIYAPKKRCIFTPLNIL